MANVVLTGKWSYPTTVWAGPDRIKELSNACQVLGIKRPLLVTDRGLKNTAMVQAALESNIKSGLSTVLYGEAKGNPVLANVNDGLKIYRAHRADGVIAMGGGSALDVGKAIAFMSGQKRPIWDFEDIGDWWTRADVSGIAPVIAIPTTAGTGSEVGRAAVILNEETHEKKIIFHPKMMPGIVISDPVLTVGLPPAVTAATGMDAFVHCFESYCAPGFHPPADGMALEGIRLIARYLPRAYKNGNDLEARSFMLAAASMGAAAFQKGLGAVHALAHPIGAVYDTHHGLTNAVLLPYVMVFNRAAIADRLTAVGRLLDLADTSFDGLLAWVLEFRRTLGIPHSLQALKVSADRAEEIGQMAQRDPSASTNPLPVSARQLAEIFRNAVAGKIEST